MTNYRPRGIDGPDLLAHLVERAEVANTNGCIVPPQKPNAKGYTSTYYKGRHVTTHRLAYQLANGPIGNDLVVDHLCRNRACINPEHLEAVTPRENVLRGDLHTNHDGRCGRCGGPLDSVRMSRHHHGGVRLACKRCQREATKRSEAKRRAKL